MILGFLAFVAMHLGPAWTAKFGHGERGTFTARYCVPHKGSCYWVGDFVSGDGTDHRSDVGFDGAAVSAAGQQVPAIDTGGRGVVYPVGGGSDWFLWTFLFVFSLNALGWWIATVPIAAVRSRHRHAESPQRAGSTG